MIRRQEPAHSPLLPVLTLSLSSCQILESVTAFLYQQKADSLSHLPAHGPSPLSAVIYAYTTMSAALDGPLPDNVEVGTLNLYTGQATAKMDFTLCSALLPTLLLVAAAAADDNATWCPFPLSLNESAGPTHSGAGRGLFNID